MHTAHRMFTSPLMLLKSLAGEAGITLQWLASVWFGCIDSSLLTFQVSLEGGNAAVIYDSALQMPRTLQEAIEEMGFISAPVSLHPQAVPTDSLTFHLTQDQPAERTCTELLALTGVVDVRPSEEGAGLSVTFIPSLVCPDDMIHRFPVLIPTKGSSQDNPTTQNGDLLVKMKVEGMTCHSCTSTIEGKIGKLNGVQRIKGEPNPPQQLELRLHITAEHRNIWGRSY